MPTRVTDGTIVFRVWKKETGLGESRVSFNTLEELFTLALHASDPSLVDRVVLQGVDESGNERTLILTFQSVTRTD